MFRLLCLCALVAVGSAGCSPPGTRDKAAADQCRPEDALKILGADLEKGTLHEDNVASPANVLPQNSEKPLDSTAQADSDHMRAAVSAVHRGLEGARFVSPERGVTRNGYTLEGTDLRVNVIQNSVLRFAGTNGELCVGVASLIQIEGCWKVLVFGFQRPRPCAQAAATKTVASAPQKRKGRFRTFADGDKCSGVRLFGAPDESAVVGELVEEYARYHNVRTNQYIAAFLLKTHVDGHLLGLWKTPADVKKLWIRDDDAALRNCKWDVRNETVEPVEGEIPIP